MAGGEAEEWVMGTAGQVRGACVRRTRTGAFEVRASVGSVFRSLSCLSINIDKYNEILVVIRTFSAEQYRRTHALSGLTSTVRPHLHGPIDAPPLFGHTSRAGVSDGSSINARR